MYVYFRKKGRHGKGVCSCGGMGKQGEGKGEGGEEAQEGQGGYRFWVRVTVGTGTLAA